MTMSDRIAVMNGGVVEQLATPRELYQRPGHAVRRRFHRHVEPDRAARRPRDDGLSPWTWARASASLRVDRMARQARDRCQITVRPE